MKTHKHTIPYTLTVELELEIEVTGTITPGDPGCRYTRNGDGWPPSGPEVYIDRVRLKTTIKDIQEKLLELIIDDGLDYEDICDLLLTEADSASEAAKEASEEAGAEMRRERMEDR